MLFVTNNIQLTQYISYEGLGDFNIGRKIIRNVKQADDIVLLAMEEKILQGMTDRLTEAARW